VTNNSPILEIMNGCDVSSITSSSRLNSLAYNATLDDFVETVLNATSIDHLSQVCTDIRYHYGFDFFTLLVRFNRYNERPVCYFVREYDDDWTDYYQKNKCMLYDPGIRISVNTTIPFLWSGEYFNELEQLLTVPEIDHCRRATDFGMQDVFSAPFQGEYGEYGLVRFVRFANGQASNKDLSVNRNKIPELYYISSFIYQAISRILVSTPSGCSLCPREKDVLIWTALGNNPAHIAYRLHISEHTVLKHLANVRKKLKVRNTTHAVAKSISSGLITI